MDDLAFRLLPDEILEAVITGIFEEQIKAFFEKFFAVVLTVKAGRAVDGLYIFHVFQPSVRGLIQKDDCRTEPLPSAGFE